MCSLEVAAFVQFVYKWTRHTLQCVEFSLCVWVFLWDGDFIVSFCSYCGNFVIVQVQKLSFAAEDRGVALFLLLQL